MLIKPMEKMKFNMELNRFRKRKNEKIYNVFVTIEHKTKEGCVRCREQKTQKLTIYFF